MQTLRPIRAPGAAEFIPGHERKDTMSQQQVEQVTILAGSLEACSLNGRPARLEQQRGRFRTTFRVVADNCAAVFNPSVIYSVITKQGGRFVTQPATKRYTTL